MFEGVELLARSSYAKIVVYGLLSSSCDQPNVSLSQRFESLAVEMQTVSRHAKHLPMSYTKKLFSRLLHEKEQSNEVFIS